MITGLQHLHSLLRWLALIAMIISLFRSFTGMRNARPYASADKRWALITLISFHVQLVIGLALYFLSGWHRLVGEMGNAAVRFFSIEHLVGMLIAIIFVTIGYSRAKRTVDEMQKYRILFRSFLIAFILVLISIPWPFRELIGRPLFPGL